MLKAFILGLEIRQGRWLSTLLFKLVQYSNRRTRGKKYKDGKEKSMIIYR